MTKELNPCKNCKFPIRHDICCKCGIWQSVDYSVLFEKRFPEPNQDKGE